MIILSKQIRNNMPIYGGVFNNNLLLNKSISNGDSCNETSITFGFHVGTHVDFPRHFVKDGNFGSNYNYFNIYKNPVVVNCHIIDSLMYIDDTLMFDTNAECVLIVATDDGDKSNNLLTSGLSLQSAASICDNLPNLKAVLLNTVSISSINNRQIGRDVHKLFLNKGVLIYEDCDFSHANMISNESILYTFHIFGLENDGSPCVIYSN